MRVYGVHTGEGIPYDGVRTANMVWDSEHNQYEFTPAHGADGPLITWTPERPEGSDLLSHTGSDIKPIDQATILVTPIPDGKDEYTTPPFPVPEERDLNDYILVFPADSGIKPIYVYLKDDPRTQREQQLGLVLKLKMGKIGSIYQLPIAEKVRKSRPILLINYEEGIMLLSMGYAKTYG